MRDKPGEAKDNLEKALTQKNPWLHDVDLASMTIGSIDPALLSSPAPSGAPLLVDWYVRQKKSSQPISMFKQAHEAREFSHMLLWRLVDAGFDPRQSWEWAPGGAASENSDGQKRWGRSDLFEVLFEEMDPSLLEGLAHRWGEPWTQTWLSDRTVPPSTRPATFIAPRLPLLHESVARGKKEMAQWLLAKGVDINQVDGHGQTTLFHATSPSMAKFLLAQGVNPLAQDRFGRTAPEHWADLDVPGQNTAPSWLGLYSLKEMGPFIPNACLARFVAMEAQRFSPLRQATRRVLKRLAPRLSEPFRFGMDPDGKLPVSVRTPAPQATLLEAAEGAAWGLEEPGEGACLEILEWLAAHTPREGLEEVHDRARAALFVFPCQVPSDSVSPLPFTRLMDVFRSRAASGPSAYLATSIARALLDATEEALCESLPDPPSPIRPHRLKLVDLRARQWLDESHPGGSPISQVFSFLADLQGLSGHDVGVPPSGLPQALLDFVQAGLPVPQDSLWPAARLLPMLSLPTPRSGAASARDELHPEVLGELLEKDAPGEGIRVHGLTLGIAWWIGAQIPRVLEGSPEAKEIRDLIEKAPWPWPAWMARWDAHRLNEDLPRSSASLPSRLPRM